MATNDTVFAGSIPELYDRLMVPLIFDSAPLDRWNVRQRSALVC